MSVDDPDRTLSQAPPGAVSFMRRHPFAVIALGAVAFSLLNLLNDSPFLAPREIEWHDTVSQWFIIAIMLGWVAITNRSQTNATTYHRFFLGCASLIWLMTIKFFGELYESQTALLTTFELLLAVAGLFLVTLGLVSWSKELQLAIESLSVSTSKYRELSETDALTGLLNRRQFDSITKHVVNREREISLVLVDLDHFKSVNDEYGHPVGDRVITRTSEILSAHMRGTDYAFRMGGEEFALLYLHCPQELVVARSETILEALASERFCTEDDRAFAVTASLGVAHRGDAEEPSKLYHRADCALYEAKSHGRNQVVVASPSPGSSGGTGVGERD